ncbi:MAG: hypothetical protein SO133_03485, partial [Alloprevotella sp.]|nr:hypothetical protein [Alloprevotella sp.]
FDVLLVLLYKKFYGIAFKERLVFLRRTGHSRLASAKVRTISDTAKLFRKYFFAQNSAVLQFLDFIPLFTGG